MANTCWSNILGLKLEKHKEWDQILCCSIETEVVLAAVFMCLVQDQSATDAFRTLTYMQCNQHVDLDPSSPLVRRCLMANTRHALIADKLESKLCTPWSRQIWMQGVYFVLRRFYIIEDTRHKIRSPISRFSTLIGYVVKKNAWNVELRCRWIENKWNDILNKTKQIVKLKKEAYSRIWW